MEDKELLQMALKQGLLTEEQVEKARSEQRSLADRGVQRTLWFLVSDLGFMNPDQTRMLRKNLSSARIRALEVEGYVIQGRIGAGGMGEVFRGRNEKGEEAAIKLLSQKVSQHTEHVRRFDREARTTLHLHHPHITQTFSSGEIDGQRYLVMELVTGPTLREYLIKEGVLPEAQARTLLIQMAEALGYAWSQNVLHRDVKPANIILGAPRPGIDEPFCAKLCDFGLAKTWQIKEDESGGSRSRVSRLTHSGIALGTPHYMSPEQASGERQLDQRCDIYSLGATLYHVLRGETMFTEKNSDVIMYKQVSETVPLDTLAVRGVGPGFIALLDKMLAKDKAARFQTWDEVLAAARAVVPGPAAPSEGPTGSSSSNLAASPATGSSDESPLVDARPSESPRSLAIVVVLAVLITALIAGTVLAWLSSRGDKNAPIVPAVPPVQTVPPTTVAPAQ